MNDLMNTTQDQNTEATEGEVYEYLIFHDVILRGVKFDPSIHTKSTYHNKMKVLNVDEDTKGVLDHLNQKINYLEDSLANLQA